MESVSRKTPSTLQWVTGQSLTVQQAKQRQLVIKCIALGALLISGALLLTLGTKLSLTIAVCVGGVLISAVFLALQLRQKTQRPSQADVPKVNIDVLFAKLDSARGSKAPVELHDFKFLQEEDRVRILVSALRKNLSLSFTTNDALEDQGKLAVRYLSIVLNETELTGKHGLINAHLCEIFKSEGRQIFEYIGKGVVICETPHTQKWIEGLKVWGITSVSLAATPAAKEHMAATTSEQTSSVEH